jgi:hypothetical protein
MTFMKTPFAISQATQPRINRGRATVFVSVAR